MFKYNQIHETENPKNVYNTNEGVNVEQHLKYSKELSCQGTAAERIHKKLGHLVQNQADYLGEYRRCSYDMKHEIIEKVQSNYSRYTINLSLEGYMT